MADFNYADDVLSGSYASSPKGGADYSSYALNDNTSIGPAGDIPKLPAAKQMPGFGAMWKESWLSDDKTRAAMYAKEMGVNPNRVRIEDGVVYYVNENQNEIPVFDESKLTKAKKIVAPLIGGELPKIAFGTGGAMFGGAAGAGAGSALGEAVRRGVGTAAFDEPRSLLDIAPIAGEGLIGAGGYGIGKLGTALYNRAGRAGMGQTGRLLAQDTGAVDTSRAAGLADLGKQFGVNLRAHELAGPQSTLAQEVFKMRNLPGSADVYQNFMGNVRDPEMKKAIQSVLDSVSPEKSIFQSGAATRDAAQASIEALKEQRRSAVEPLYSSAFDNSGGKTVDVTPIGEHITKRLGPEGARGDIRAALEKARGIIYGAGGEELPATPRGLHEAKMALDSDIEVAKRTGNNAVARELTEVRNVLRGALEDQVPGYKAANNLYKNMSAPIEQAQNSVVGPVADLEGDKVIKAGRMLLGSDTASPETVMQAKALIRGQNPNAWDAMVRGHLQDKYEQVVDKLASGNVANVGGKFRNLIFGNEKQRKIIDAALGDSPDKLRALHQFSDILDAVGPSFAGGSQTAPLSATMTNTVRNLEGTGAKAVRAMRGLNWMGNVEDYLSRKGLRENAPRVMEELLSPDGAKMIQSIRQLPPGSERQIQAFASFMALASNGALQKFRTMQNYTPDDYVGRAGMRR